MLSIVNLHKRFGTHTAVHIDALDIRPGEFVVVVGPSGCGKTTLLRLIAGFEKPDGGTIALDGANITSLQPQERGIGMVFQNYALFPHMTVRENISFGLKAKHVGASEIISRADRALSSVRLSHKANSGVPLLSGGEQQRVAVARAIVTQPKLLLMDEPLSNLDPVLRDELRTEIARVHRETLLTTLYVTHDQSEALALADRIIVMSGGRIEQFDVPEELYFHPSTPFVAEFMGGAQIFPAVVRIQDGQALARLTEGLELQLSGSSYAGQAPGSALRVAVKPEGVCIDAGGAPGVVRSRTFIGPAIECEVEVGGLVLRSRAPSTPRTISNVGDSIAISLDPSLCTVFAG